MATDRAYRINILLFLELNSAPVPKKGLPVIGADGPVAGGRPSEISRVGTAEVDCSVNAI